MLFGNMKKGTGSEDVSLTGSKHNGAEKGANVLFWQNTSKMLSAAEKKEKEMLSTYGRPS